MIGWHSTGDKMLLLGGKATMHCILQSTHWRHILHHMVLNFLSQTSAGHDFMSSSTRQRGIWRRISECHRAFQCAFVFSKLASLTPCWRGDASPHACRVLVSMVSIPHDVVKCQSVHIYWFVFVAYGYSATQFVVKKCCEQIVQA